MALNATLMKRLFRAIADGSYEELGKIAEAIIDDENKKGHTLLANELRLTLRNAKRFRPEPNAVFELRQGSLSVLPKSRRHEIPLTTYIPSNSLLHHMILPNQVEERFRRIEQEFAARDRLMLHGFMPRKKILLYGPPGCGKTMGAQRLAKNLGLPLLKVRFDSLVSSYLGETASNLRAIFESANQMPCVLFFDECDSIAKSRSGGQDVGEIKRVVNFFLQMLDEYEAPGLLVAATNLSKELDEAVWRRFDDAFEVPMPGPEELKKLVVLTLSSMKTELKDWERILKEAKSFSAAQMVRAAQDAAKKVILDGKDIVNDEILIAAIRERRGALLGGSSI